MIDRVCSCFNAHPDCAYNPTAVLVSIQFFFFFLSKMMFKEMWNILFFHDVYIGNGGIPGFTMEWKSLLSIAIFSK